jgi:hypothetical protein
VGERVEYGLPPRGTVGLFPYRGDDVDKLRLAGDLYSIGVVEQRDQEASYY